MIRVGIMGKAKIAVRSLIPAFEKHSAFEVAAIGSRDLAKGCSYDELLTRKDVDLIYCPLPTGLHYAWVKKALLAGKHVLCEKSLGCNAAEVEDLVNTARAQKRFLMESFQFRFHAQNLYVKDLLAKNAIGPIRQVVIRFGIPPFPEGVSNIRYAKKLGGGALLDNGAYTVKCTAYLLGKDVEVLAAMAGGNDPALGNVDLTGSIMMKVGNVAVQTSYGFDHYYQNSYEIWGKDGKISTVRAFTAREDFCAPVFLETKAGGQVTEGFKDDHFARLLDHIAATIESGDFESEYEESLVQARLLQAVREKCHGNV